MIRYLLKKTGSFLLVFLGITFLSFCLTYLSPSDAAEIKLNKTGVAPSAELLEQTRAEMGLDRSLLVRYGEWLGNFLKGDMGTSLKSGKPVVAELKKALPQQAPMQSIWRPAAQSLTLKTGTAAQSPPA